MKWRGIFRRRAERDLEDELSSHLAFQARKHVAQGLSEEEALRRARIEFGSAESAREECREIDRWRWVDSGARNFRHALRSLARNPGFALISLSILTVGIGANVAVFSVADAVFLRPLPVERPDELLWIALQVKHGSRTDMPSTALRVLEGNRTLAGVCGIDTSLLPVEIGGSERSLGIAGLTGGCFETLKLGLEAGRGIARDDDHDGASRVVVISDALWHGSFGARRDVIGKTLRAGGELYTIVGVAEPRFHGFMLGFSQDVLMPLEQEPGRLENGKRPVYRWVSVLARRRAGVSEAQARASVLAQRTQLLEESVPHRYNARDRKEYLERNIDAGPGATGIDFWLRNRFGESLYEGVAICATLLLIACVNLTSLALARSLTRRHEVSVRLALGAKPGHIAGLFVLEQAILVAAGAGLGVFGGLFAARSILACGGAMFGNFRLDVGLDGRVLAFLAGVMIAVLAIFAAASAWQASRLALSGDLRERSRGVIASNHRTQKILLGVQIALTLAFVTASGLLVLSVRNEYNIDFGIRAPGLWEAELVRRPNQFAPADYYRSLLEEMQDLPEMESVALSDTIPFYTYAYSEPVAMVENAQIAAVPARLIGASDGFFATLGMKLIAGEDFRRDPSNTDEPTAILSESLARHFGNSAALIGGHARFGNWEGYQHLRIAGVVSDADLNLVHPENQRPFTIYVNFWQHREAQGRPVALIRMRDGAIPPTELRRIIEERGYAYVDRMTSIGSEIDDALVENRLVAYLGGVFGVMTLAMAAIGLFGLLSYQVSNRVAEIGIRMALGAMRGQVQWMILRQAAQPLLLGALGGIGLTLAAGKAMAGLLFGVSANDVSVLAVSVIVIALTALLAAWIPARRASSIDPLQALRHE